MCCSLTHKTHQAPRLRLDTLQQSLVCASCMKGDLLQVDLLGRTFRFRQQHFYLCPICVSIQQYNGQGEQPWYLPPEDPTCRDGVVQQMCVHMPSHSFDSQFQAKKKAACFVCMEPALVHAIDRVDHLTGKILQFYFCQRHMPRADVLLRCVNARQMGGFNPVWRG